MIDFSRLASQISAAAAWKMPVGKLSTPVENLVEHFSFGSNPGQLRMLTYRPQALTRSAPLVVVLHGCTQTAASYDIGTGWSALAEEFGFSLLLPEQQRANNPNGCFNWFLPDDNRRGAGEALSISQMIDHLIREGTVDPTRVFITGLSAGGAMAAVMMATYPEKVAAGAIIAGLPFGSADSVPGALKAMAHADLTSSKRWGDLVRRASSHKGPWPRLSVWHGSADKTVAPTNGRALVAQWLDVHGLTGKPDADRDSGCHRSVWRDGSTAMVEENIIPGMAHGAPLAPNADVFPHGRAGPFLLDVGVPSSLHIAIFFGIASLPAETLARTSRLPSLGDGAPSSFANTRAQIQHPRNVKSVIDRALRSAGLLK